MDITKEKACLCALNRIFGFEPRIATALLSHFDRASEVFELNEKDISGILGPFSRFSGQIKAEKIEESADELIRLAGSGTRFVGWNEDGYPPLLKECPDAPVGLYIRSKTEDSDLWTPHPVSVVGTRDLSPYGREWCTRIVNGFAACPARTSVISGLAIGTDICAHRTAIDSGLPTIAVMATGPETIYPLRHTDFAMNMIHTPGCALVTDFPPGTPPLAAHFLRRNRIIAGLSEATILIESKIKGGGIMTANLAFSYGRGVYALPGRIDDSCSQGCNNLIRAKVAEAVTGADTLIRSLGLPAAAGKTVTDKEKLSARYMGSMTQEKIDRLSSMLLLIRRHRGITVEELADMCGADYSSTVRLAGLLESDGFITIDLLQRCCINARK